MNLETVAEGDINIVKDTSPVGDLVDHGVASHAVGVGRVLLVGIGNAVEEVVDLGGEHMAEGIGEQAPEGKGHSQGDGLAVQALDVFKRENEIGIRMQEKSQGKRLLFNFFCKSEQRLSICQLSRMPFRTSVLRMIISLISPTMVVTCLMILSSTYLSPLGPTSLQRATSSERLVYLSILSPDEILDTKALRKGE